MNSVDSPATRTVVVIDPNSAAVAFIRRVLSGLGWRVNAFHDPQKAITFCESNNVPVVLVIARIILSGEMNGIAVADAITSRHPAIKVILISDYGRAVLLKLVGFTKYSRNHLLAPLTEAALLKKVRQVAGDYAGGEAGRAHHNG